MFLMNPFIPSVLLPNMDKYPSLMLLWLDIAKHFCVYSIKFASIYQEYIQDFEANIFKKLESKNKTSYEEDLRRYREAYNFMYK
jgi:hypothetical protein